VGTETETADLFPQKGGRKKGIRGLGREKMCCGSAEKKTGDPLLRLKGDSSGRGVGR